jgi:hypothetical protein
MSQPALVEFDLDRYLRNSKKVDLSEIEWSRVADYPLSDGDVMCLHYMMDIETHTVIYLRDLLATRVAADPQITAFLASWVCEELCTGSSRSSPSFPTAAPRFRAAPIAGVTSASRSGW